MYTGILRFSVPKQKKKGFQKLKNYVGELPNQIKNHNELSTTAENVNDKSYKEQMQQKEINANNQNCLLFCNGKVKHKPVENALNESNSSKYNKNVNLKITKIKPNIRNDFEKSNLAKTESLIRKEVNGIEKEENKNQNLILKDVLNVSKSKVIKKSYEADEISKFEGKKNVLISNKVSNKSKLTIKNTNIFYQKNLNLNENCGNLYKNKKETFNLNSKNLIKTDKLMHMEIDNSKSFQEEKLNEKEFFFVSTYERFKNNQLMINAKKLEMKRKQEEIKLNEVKKIPTINKSSKYNEKLNQSNFLERVEMQRTASFAKRSKLTQKIKNKENEELNQNAKLKAKKPLCEIQKSISEKLIKAKIKTIEKDRKAMLLKREKQISQLAQCTFKPEISKNSKLMDISCKRRKYDLSKSYSVCDLNQKLIESKKYYKLEKLDTSTNLNNVSFYVKLNHGNEKDLENSNFNYCKTFNLNTINISDADKNRSFSVNNNYYTFEKNKNDENKNSCNSMNNSLNKTNSYFSSSKNKNLKQNIVPISKPNEFANNDINISQKESEILKRLLIKKLDF